jgi:hypothetical protein
MSKAYVETFPVFTDLSEIVKDSFEKLVQEIRFENKEQNEVQGRIDQLVYELYGLTEEEIAIVKGSGDKQKSTADE